MRGGEERAPEEDKIVCKPAMIRESHILYNSSHQVLGGRSYYTTPFYRRET